MEHTAHRETKAHPENFTLLVPHPPYTDILLHKVQIHPREFAHVAAKAQEFPSDPRLVEMVRRAGDSSGKVAYLLDWNETQESILDTLREVAQPHVEHLHRLPDAMQATIDLLLSINAVPLGCHAYAIPALLEIDRMQASIIKSLHGLMQGRRLAADFHSANVAALQALDADWHNLREHTGNQWPQSHPMPKSARMHFEPVYQSDHLIHVHETCVVVDAPLAAELQRLTPPVLRRPLPENVPAPTTGSADWLIREVGKIGRHFTRALLDVIKARLEVERLALDSRDYEHITHHAVEALRDFVEGTP